MRTEPFVLFSLICMIAIAASTFTALFPKLRLPTAVLELLLGIFLGKSGLHTLPIPSWFHDASSLGLLYLMFLAGLEIRPPQKGTPQTARVPYLLIFSMFAQTAALSILAGQLLIHLGWSSDPLLSSFIFATTSLGILVPVLHERGLSASRFGQLILLTAVTADIATATLIGIALPTRSSAFSIPLQLITMTSLGFLLYFASRMFLRGMRSRVPMARRGAFGMRGALAIVMVCGATARVIGAESILAGFTAGLVGSWLARDQHNALRSRLETLGYSLFLPFFFISTGMSLTLTHARIDRVASHLPLYLLLAFAVKIIGSLSMRFQFTWRETFAAGTLLSTRFTLVIAVAALAAHAHLIGQTEEATLLLTALATVILAPLAFSLQNL